MRKLNPFTVVKKSLAGAMAGFLATVPMTIAMKGIHRKLPLLQRKRSMPPRKITRRILGKLRIPNYGLRKRKEAALTMASHFGYGAAGGVAYSAFAENVDIHPAVKGTAFGLAVWAGSYFGWLPATKILPASSEHWKRHTMMAISHVVWGSVMGIVYDRVLNAE